MGEMRVTPSMIRSMLSHADTVGLGDDFVVSRLQGVLDYSQLQYPFRIDSYLAAYCIEGEVSCMVNLTEYRLGPGMMIVITPGNVVRIIGLEADKTPRFTIINAASSFLLDIGYSLTQLFSEVMTVLKNPCIRVTESEAELMKQYVDLVYSLIGSQSKYVRESVSTLLTSIFYQFASFLDGTLVNKTDAGQTGGNRHLLMFEQFMKLVNEHHQTERMVAFYADSLCVTPKYLSKVIKDVSGKSAPEWINDAVILSTKHLLRHSELSIKEIASMMNFPSQSFFFRYFKSATGQTPNQFRQNA